MNAKKYPMALLFFFVLMLASVSGQIIDTKSERFALMEEFNQRYDYQWRIRWDEATGTPASILGHEIREYSGTPHDIALALLAKEKGMFGINDVGEDLREFRVNYSNLGGTRITFEQRYEGVPILNSGYLVAVRDDGSIYYLSGDYYPDIKLETTPNVSQNEVISIIGSDMAGTSIDSMTTPLRSIRARSADSTTKYELVYKVEVFGENPLEAWRYLVDAATGYILVKESMILNADPDPEGRVYLTNPEHHTPDEQPLNRLIEQDPLYLNGTNVIVYRTGGSRTSEPRSQPYFYYDIVSVSFDEVMVYYHSDEFEDWLVDELGMGSDKVDKVTAYVDATVCGASSIPQTRLMWFPHSDDYCDYPYEDQFNNSTREAAIITHEYMHIVSHTYNSLGPGAEAAAMDEAYSDYFAVAYTYQYYEDAIIGEYTDKDGGKTWQRELINSYTYDEFGEIDYEPDDENTKYDNCMIFSGALWDFRRDNDVSNTIADMLILESLNNLDASPDFLDGGEALQVAAVAAEYSSYLDDIVAAFDNHGIQLPPENLTLENLSIGTTEVYVAINSITAGPNFTVESTGDVTFRAGSKITLKPGFHAKAGSKFKAYIDSGLSGGPLPKVAALASGAHVGEEDTETPVEESDELIPTVYSLSHAYPNPFNPVTTIRYSLPEAARTRLVVYDLLGREVMRLVDGTLEPGYHAVVWNGRSAAGREVPSGIYIARLITPAYTKSIKMLLLK